MFQNGQRVCFKSGGDPARIQKVQLAYGKDRSRAPQVIPTTDTNATQVQIVTGEDAARYPFIDPIGLIGAPAAWFRADTGVTVTGLGASTWADQSGNGRDLLQTTDASRPPYLSYSASSGKYLYLPGVAGNYASCPDPATFPTADADLIVRLSMDDWTPAAISVPLGKIASTNQRSCWIDVTTTGGIRLNTSPDGTAGSQLTGASTASVSFTDGQAGWIRATIDVNDGAGNRVYKFYTAADSADVPTSWTQLGTTVTTAGTTSIFDSTSIVEVGGALTGTSNMVAGKIYRAIIKNGIDGTTVVDFNPDLDGSDQAATFTSSATGEVWTINKSGGLPAQIVASPRLIGDGSADAMATANFTLNQPCSGLMVVQAVSWTAGDYLCSGTVAEAGLTQVTATPQVGLNAGSAAAANSGITVGAWKVVYYELNGASSKIKVGSAAATTGNAGANNPGGLALFRNQGATAFGNAMLREWIVFSAALDDAAIARAMNYASGRWGVAL